MTSPPTFKYYNGAYLPGRYATLGAWVKYVDGPNEIKILREGQGWVHIKAPDRELILTRDALTTSSARPFGEGFHEYVPFSWTNTCSKGLAAEQFMTNYVPHTQPSTPSTGIRKPGCLVRDGRRILSDSGGFQVYSNVVDWVDPVEVARWYVDNVDEGTVLDIPGGWYSGSDQMMRAARVQYLNAQKMRKHLPKKFPLFNVIHGGTIDHVNMYRDIVEGDDVRTDYVAISGVYNADILYSMHRLAHIILDKKRPFYKQYHALGVYNNAVLCPMIRMAALLRKHYPERQITLSSDASTNIYSSTNRTFHLAPTHYKSLERMNLSRMVTLSEHTNPSRYLACGCPMCTTLKYTDIVSHVKSAIVAHMLITHNSLEIDRWTRMMTEYAEKLSPLEYIELTGLQVPRGKFRQGAMAATAFVEDIFQYGLKKAALRRRPQLTGTLFANPADEMLDNEDGSYKEEANLSEEGEHGEAKLAPAVKEDVDENGHDKHERRAEVVIRKYEHYHETGQRPVTVKKKGKKRANEFFGNSAGKSLTPNQKKTFSKAKTEEEAMAEREKGTFGRHAKNRPKKDRSTALRKKGAELLMLPG